MTLRSCSWTKCCDGIGKSKGAYIPTRTVATYAPPANMRKSRRVSKAETLRYPLLKIQGGGSKYSTQVLWGENPCGGFRRSAQIAQNVPCGHKASANRHGIFAKFRDHDLQPAGGPGKGAAPQRKK